jgi:hypothetical protein
VNTATVWLPDATLLWKDTKKETLPLINFDALLEISKNTELGKNVQLVGH